MEKSIPADAALQQSHGAEYVGLIRAMQILEGKYQATVEELAAWIFWGSENNGIDAYTNANELNPPPKFSFAYFICCDEYIGLLNNCWFLRDDIEKFTPADRYITGEMLFERWSNVPGYPSSFIRARIRESRLMPFHPTFGVPQGVFEENYGSTPSPPLKDGLFSLRDVEDVEAEEGLIQPEKCNMIAHGKSETVENLSRGQAVTQQQAFRGLCIDELRKYARRWMKHFSKVPIKKVILYEHDSEWTPYLNQRNPASRRLLYVVVFEIPGLEWPETRLETTFPPPPEQLEKCYLDGHPWQDFLEKLDNIPDHNVKENSHFLFYNGFELVYSSPPPDTWKQEWQFVAVADLDSLPEDVDHGGPFLVLWPLAPVQEQPTADQATPGAEQNWANYLEKDQIERYLGRSWNTCKRYMREFGFERGGIVVDRWLLPIEIADKITKKYPPEKK